MFKNNNDLQKQIENNKKINYFYHLNTQVNTDLSLQLYHYTDIKKLAEYIIINEFYGVVHMLDHDIQIKLCNYVLNEKFYTFHESSFEYQFWSWSLHNPTRKTIDINDKTIYPDPTFSIKFQSKCNHFIHHYVNPYYIFWFFGVYLISIILTGFFSALFNYWFKVN